MPTLLPPLDSAFLYIESHETPMHVAGLQVFSLPVDARPGFVRELVAQLRSPIAFAAPWNRKLLQGPLGRVVPAWITDDDVDLEYHVRHLALPAPGGQRELGELVSRLHSHRLNRKRPLWECNVIEGLEGNRFALFIKMHHALADGVTALRLLTEALSADPGVDTAPPWAARESASAATEAAPVAERPSAFDAAVEQVRALPETTRALGALARSVGASDGLALPFAAPPSVLNRRITGQRRLATQQLDIQRLKHVAALGGATLNDVVLALCGAALRRFLKEMDALPVAPLVASVPVSLRAAGESGTGNAVSMVLSGLATDVADPRKRLAVIAGSMRRAKQHLHGLSVPARAQYTSLLLAPYVASLGSGLGGRTRPFHNVTVSNVPGPTRPLYLRGARLEAMYPVSIPTHGQALNITCVSYAGRLNFGITGCRDALPHLQRLALYTADALTELETALGVTGDELGTASHRSVAATTKARPIRGRSAARRRPRHAPAVRK